jgi:subtilisin family serine protease
VLVLKEGVSSNPRSAIEAAGGRVRSSNDQIGVYTTEGLSDAAVAALGRRAEVEAVVPDVVTQWLPPMSSRGMRVLHASGLTPGKRTDQSGAFFFDLFQWNMRVIKADQAWLVSKQGRGALVCVLDTGIDPTHIDLTGKLDESISTSFIDGEPVGQDLGAHGTFVAAQISSNGLGMASVAPDATLCSMTVLDSTGSGSFADVIAAIYTAASVRADVINMSLGAYFSRKEDGAKELIRAMQRAIDFASRKGVLVVAAAGNDGVNTNVDPRDMIVVPAQLEHVVSVGATGPTFQQDFDGIPSYSNYGISGVDVFAPGGGDAYVDNQGNLLNETDLIIGPCSPSAIGFGCGPLDYLVGNGTSFASPLAAGEGAVIESQSPHNQGDEFLSACIIATADKVTPRRVDPIYAFGRIDVLKGSSCQTPGPFARR